MMYILSQIIYKGNHVGEKKKIQNIFNCNKNWNNLYYLYHVLLRFGNENFLWKPDITWSYLKPKI